MPSRWRATAHPRSRGENAREMTGLTQVQGSSPLTRGKQGWRPAVVDHVGLIPAHAGKTTSGGRATCRPRAHPRSRGENPARHLMLRHPRGSSPLTRAKRASLVSTSDVGLAHPRSRGENRDVAGACDHVRGFIPAHAGKTHIRRSCQACGRAHPRSRGENVQALHRDGQRSGSSPLTRGKRGAGTPAAS